jgi:hypothetical protein
MKKKFLAILLTAISVIALTGCWAGEVGVTTEFENKAGGGVRTYVLDVMDDTLSTTAITNPDDPDKTEGKGAVINSTHIEGGVSAIQAWLTANAPSFVTVAPMKTEGYHRLFTISFEFDDFADFLSKYQQLVDASDNVAWTDFDAAELPTWTVDGQTCTFTESKAIVQASMDWAISGIWEDIYVEADLAGYVTKDDISVLANYKVVMGEEVFEELGHFDPAAVDGTGTGAMVYVESESFTLTNKYPISGWAIGGIISGCVILVAGAVYFLVLRKEKV